MAIIATKGEKKVFDPVPAGNHVARVYRVLHIGTIPKNYKGEEKMVDTLVIGFELPNETKVFKEERGEEPYVISRELSLSMNEKANLRHLVEGMLGVVLKDEEAESFDVLSLMGKTCLINVVHEKAKTSENVYANIQGASPLPKGMTCPDAVNDPQVLDYDNWDAVVYGNLPGFLKEKVESSEEFKFKFPDGVAF